MGLVIVRQTRQSDYEPEGSVPIRGGSSRALRSLMREFSHFIGNWCHGNIGHINIIRPAGYRLGNPQRNSFLFDWLFSGIIRWGVAQYLGPVIHGGVLV